MSNPAASFINWYRRYKVGASDMTTFKQSLLDTMRGPWEGETGAAVLDGFETSLGSGLSVDVSSGIAVGATGDLMAITGTTEVTFASPVANPCRSLIVARPKLVGDTPIVNPVSPFDTVYLNVLHEAEIVVINGTAASAPAYPATLPNDVVLAAVRLEAGASAVTIDKFDTDQRDDFGRNGGDLALLTRGDPRCRPEIASQKTITITPSQTINGETKLFLYAGSAKPSAFPLTAGIFTPSNTTLNFETGAITGGDGTSADFTPTLPSAGNFIWAIVTLGTTGLLSVGYGTIGTYAQCKAALKNQTSDGSAGSVPVAAAYKIALVLVGSSNGSVVTEIELVDARAPGNFQAGTIRAITSVTSVNSPYTMDGTEEVIEMDASGGAVTVTLPARASNLGRAYSFDRIDTTEANNCSVAAAGADTIDEPVSTTIYPFDPYQSQSFFAGSAKWKVRG